MAITPYLLFINPTDPNDPIRRQFIPTIDEDHHLAVEIEDSLNEDHQSPVYGIVHRYPDRCLFLTTFSCAGYCRFCTRSHSIRKEYQEDFMYTRQLDYIRQHTEIRDVIVSGGDPCYYH